MNTELLIFSLISLIILIPIIYFLPLNLTKKGKITVIAVSFLIAIAGLLTKVFMQLWQSILLLIGLILLLSMILTKKFSPVLFSAANGSANEIESDDHEKDTKTANFTKMESIPVMPSYGMNENADMRNESLELEKPEDKTIVWQKNEDYKINELEELHAFENNADKEKEVIFPNDDALFSPSLQSAAFIENKETPPLSHLEWEEIEELAPIALEEQPEAEKEEMVVNGDLSYLSELEEFMLESQAEVAASSEIFAEPETETDTEFEPETGVQSDDTADIETLLNSQLEEETEHDNDSRTEAALEEDMEQVSTAGYPDLTDLSDEDLQVVYNEEVEPEETMNEAPVVEAAPENIIEDVQHPVQGAEGDGSGAVYEDTIDEMKLQEIQVTPFAEQQNPMEALAEIQEAAAETEVFPEEHPALSENNGRTIEHREVFETLLLQAEIAKKMQNKEQFEQIVESFLTYDESDNERYKMLKNLLKDYIKIMK
ncbi:hypothetical protein ACFFLP_17290 [Bacillus benzoevorans]